MVRFLNLRRRCEEKKVLALKEKEDRIMLRKHLLFYGRVQGVGFRYYAVHKARQLALTGWVRNLYDGSVEMEVQGTEEKIDELIQFLDGQRYISITDIKVKKLPLTDERDFYERL